MGALDWAMDQDLSPSYYALANYIEENRDAALNSTFKDKKLKDYIAADPNVDVSNDKNVRSFIVGHCDDPVLVSMQLELMVRKDPAEFVAQLQAGMEGEVDSDLRQQKLECLLLMAGQTPPTPAEDGQARLEQLESHYKNIGAEQLAEKILSRLDKPESPVAALALYLGADKPWVRRRLEEQTKDPQVWQELVVGNFNSSPKVLAAGVERLVESGINYMPEPEKHRLFSSLWVRPDYQLYVAGRREQLGLHAPDMRIGGLPEAAGLAGIMSCEPQRKKARAETVAELLALLDEQLAARQPNKDLLEYYTEMGCSPTQAKLRASYCEYASRENAGTANPVAARRLAASLQAPRQLDRASAIPSSLQGWKRRIQNFVEKCCVAFTRTEVESQTSLRVDPQHLGRTQPSAGYQSWEHKDALVDQIEVKLEKFHALNLQNIATDDPWKILRGGAKVVAQDTSFTPPGEAGEGLDI